MIGAVVVSHNSREDLAACLRNLLDQQPRPAVVVVDNASTDGSADEVRPFIGDALQLLELERNTGFAGGCNRGLEALPAEADPVAFLNPDVTLAPGCLAVCAGALEADERVGAVAPLLLRPDGETVDSAGQLLHPVTLEVRDRGYGAPLDPEILRPRPVLAACGALAVLRRSALEDVSGPGGPWAEHFFCFWEDLELGWRLVGRGWKVMALPAAVACHGRGAGAARGRGPLRWRRSPMLEACVLSNRWMTLIRHLHTLDLVVRLPLLLAWDMAAVGLGVVRRPALAGELRRRWPLVVEEWRRRGSWRRLRLRDLPC